MMDIFPFRESLIREYAAYVESFIQIRNEGSTSYVRESLDLGSLWPEPLLQLNPAFAPGAAIDELV